MSNSLEFIRDLVHIRQTPQNKGLEFDFRVKLYDNGLVEVNGHGYKNEELAHSVISANRQFAQCLEQLVQQHVKRRAN